VTLLPDDLLRILLAIGVGGVIGLEREFRDKAAGFRTLIFICVGATLFTLFSVKLAGEGDPTRIASNIVSGVGFLGAGVILRERGRVIGLTTAATIWLVAALGMGLAGGQYPLVLVVTGITLLVLWVFPALARWIGSIRDERTYRVVCGLTPDKQQALEQLFRDNGLRIGRRHQGKVGLRAISSWQVTGTTRNHERVIQHLLADPDIDEFQF
jgi:putative Mg2+ transporter-C (MgtC) family protein